MKGLVFNLVQEVVEELLGPDGWDDVVRESNVSGAYTALGDYPDADLDRLVATVAGTLGTTRGDALQQLGRRAYRHLAARDEIDLASSPSWDQVLIPVDGDLHGEGRRVYHGAEFPELQGRRADDGVVLLEYRSSRRLCELAVGLVLGVGDWYGAALTVEQATCVERGDDACTIRATES